MTKKLVWRLGKLPSPDEVRELVKDKIITQEEAREVLFKEESENDRDTKSLEEEIKFLRTLVEKLSTSSSRIVEVIKEVHRPWQTYPWYQPYNTWTCVTSGSNTSGLAAGGSIQTNAMLGAGGGHIASGNLNGMQVAQGTGPFSDIKTF